MASPHAIALDPTWRLLDKIRGRPSELRSASQSTECRCAIASGSGPAVSSSLSFEQKLIADAPAHQRYHETRPFPSWLPGRRPIVQASISDLGTWLGRYLRWRSRSRTARPADVAYLFSDGAETRPVLRWSPVVMPVCIDDFEQGGTTATRRGYPSDSPPPVRRRQCRPQPATSPMAMTSICGRSLLSERPPHRW